MEDNGTGTPEKVCRQALESFFTAKQKGTGLSLTIVPSILHSHKNLVLTESAPSQGTTVRLFCPDQTPKPQLWRMH